MGGIDLYDLIFVEEVFRTFGAEAGPLGIAHGNGAVINENAAPKSNEGKAVLAARGKCAVGISAHDSLIADQQCLQPFIIFSCRPWRQEIPNFIRPLDVFVVHDLGAVLVDDTDGIVAALLPDGVERKRLVLLINRVQGIVPLAAVVLRPADLRIAEAGKERTLQLQRFVVFLVDRLAVARAVCAGGVGHGIGLGLQLQLLRCVIADAVARAVRGKAAGVIRAVGLGEHNGDRRVLRGETDFRAAAQIIQRDGFSGGEIEVRAGVAGDIHVAGKGQGACAQRDRALAAGVAGNPAGAEVGGRAVPRQRDRAALVVLNFDGNGAALLRHGHSAVGRVDARAGIFRDRAAVEVDIGIIVACRDGGHGPVGGRNTRAGIAGDRTAVEVDGIIRIGDGGHHTVPLVAGDDAVVHVEGSPVNYTGAVFGVADVADDRAIRGIVGAFLIVAAAVHIERAGVINAANRVVVNIADAVRFRAGHADAHAVKLKGGSFCNRNSSAAVAGDEAAVAGELAIRKYQTRVIHHKESALCIRYIAGKGMPVQTDHKRAALPNIDSFREGDIIGKVIVERFSLVVRCVMMDLHKVRFRSDHVHF